MFQRIVQESGVIKVYRSLQVWSNRDTCAAIEETFDFGGEVWSVNTQWIPNSTPEQRDFSAHMLGNITTSGAGYYDYINNQNGYAEAEGRAVIGTKITGQNPNGTTNSEHTCSQAISGVKITAYNGAPPIAELTKVGVSASLGWPPEVSITAEFVPKQNYENPDSIIKFFDDAISTCSGYYKSWTIDWRYTGFHPTCKAKGCGNINGRPVPSTASASLYFYFTP